MADTVTASAASEGPVAGVKHARLRTVRSGQLWLLLFVYFFSLLDRQVINILADGIQRDLRLSDTQLGSMTGSAFALFYGALSLPISAAAARWSRVKIIALSLAFWSLFTMASGAAQSFVQLFLARMAVGVGEAGGGPSTQALVADMTPPAERASALAFVGLGVPLGGFFGLTAGGLLADWIGWRATFVVIGAPGVILAIVLALALRDPRTIVSSDPAFLQFRLAFREIMSKHAFRWIAIGGGCSTFLSYAVSSFYAPFFFRNHAGGLGEIAGWLQAVVGLRLGPTAVLGLALGLLAGLGGVIGISLGGRLGDRAAKKGRRGYVLIAAIGALAAGPLYAAGFLVPTIYLSLPLLLAGTALNWLWFGPVSAAVQGIVQASHRAVAAAVLGLILIVIGLGVGPPLIGLLSDNLAIVLGRSEGLRWSMISACALGPIAAAAYYAASEEIERESVHE